MPLSLLSGLQTRLLLFQIFPTKPSMKAARLQRLTLMNMWQTLITPTLSWLGPSAEIQLSA
jgi:hypothetical protein